MNPYSLTIRNGSTSSPVVFGQNFDRSETANRIPPLSGHYRETSTLRVFFSGNDAAIFKTDKESPGRRFTHPLPSPQTHSTTFRWCSCENGPILAFLLAYFASIFNSNFLRKNLKQHMKKYRIENLDLLINILLPTIAASLLAHVNKWKYSTNSMLRCLT